MVNGFFREISEEEIMSVNGGCGGNGFKNRIPVVENPQLYLFEARVKTPVRESTPLEVVTFKVKTATTSSGGGCRGWLSNDEA